MLEHGLPIWASTMNRRTISGVVAVLFSRTLRPRRGRRRVAALELPRRPCPRGRSRPRAGSVPRRPLTPACPRNMAVRASAPVRRAVVEQHARDRPDGLIHGRKDARGPGPMPVDGGRGTVVGRLFARPRKPSGREAVPEQAARAEPRRGVRQPRGSRNGDRRVRNPSWNPSPGTTGLLPPAISRTSPPEIKRTTIGRYHLR